MDELEKLTRAAREQSAIDAFRALGYPVDPIRIELADWRRCGFDPGVCEPGVLVHAGRHCHVELLALDAHSSAAELIRRYRSYDKELRPLVAVAHEGALSFWSWEEGSARCIRFDPARCSRDERSRVLALAVNGDDASQLETRIERAFSPGDLEEKFLERFRRIWSHASDELGRWATDGDEADAQALLILSRLLFLSYVQLKGWLDGDRDFLSRRTESVRAVGGSIHRSFLDPLFFSCLNTPAGRRRRVARAMGRIPYLNGGLFSRSPFERREPRAELSDSLLVEAMTECFDRFSFSVTESEELELAIDPEMLGRVFETLMGPNERKRTGSFYTPRKVVDQIVGDTIGSWLAAGDEDLERMLRVSVDSIGASNARVLRSRLRRVRVVDPACGSGAFLMAALRCIEGLSERLGRLTGNRPFSRRSIVERSLHGVDLKPEAVQLCELRLWLAIVARDDATTARSVRPLPHLDRNVLQGNSLLSDLDGSLVSSASARWNKCRERHADLVKRYRSAPPTSRARIRRQLRASDLRLATELAREAYDQARRELKSLAGQRNLFGDRSAPHAGIDRAERRVRKRKRLLTRIERGELDFFSWEIGFAHFGGLFDVIVGNPPWVRSARLEPLTRRRLAERFESARGGGRGVPQFDLAALFLERSLRLSDTGARIGLLVPSKVLTSDWASPIRRKIGSSHRLIELSDLSREKGLFDADTFPVSLLIGSETRPGGEARVASSGETFTIPVQGDGSPWILIRPRLREAVAKITSEFPPLENVIGRRPLMGMKTGANGLFFVDLESIEGPMARLDCGIEVPVERLAMCVRGRDLDRWSANPDTWMLWPPSFTPEDEGWIGEYCAARRVDRKRLRPSYLCAEHVGLKVVWKDLSKGMRAAVLTDKVTVGGGLFPLVPNQTLYLIDVVSMDEGYALAGVLNSCVGNVLCSVSADAAKDGHRRYFARTVASMPMFSLDLTRQPVRDVIRVARSAEASGADASSELDRAVARAFGISCRELAVFERAVSELGV